ncbi:MAG: hypothetical protein GC155_03275 [Alphaproteobacteria bacterium]|nr:hypothetical protein [Alphaproteobacteria bacterium]
MLEEASRSLPPFALHPTTVLLFALLVRACLKTPHASGRLVLMAVWLRYVMQAYHEVTYTSFGGVSINAMGTLAVVCAGVLVLRSHVGQLIRFPVILTLMAVIVTSGLINGVIGPTIETLLKWGYFFVVLLAVRDCILRDGDARILGLLLWAFAPPLIYQALSLVLGVAKATESDGSVSYIGGYYHEAAFSVVLVTCFVVASLAPRINLTFRLFLLVASLAGIFAANYRTSLIAVAPVAFGYFVFGIARGASRTRRVIISMIGLVMTVCGLLAANIALSQRMNDINRVAADTPQLVRAPEEFTVAEQKLLSGRLYIWNRYLDAYSTGSDEQLLLGFGPDSWVDTFGVYAHNTIVSYLYEFGMVGALLIVMVWIGMLARAMRIRDWTLRGQLVCIHIGFILLNMATMPFWQMEGLILYGLLCGYTICISTVPNEARRKPKQAPLLATYLRAARRMRPEPPEQLETSRRTGG